jgi:hypothetical protein
MKPRRIVRSSARHTRWIAGAAMIAAGLILPVSAAAAASSRFMAGGGLQFGPQTGSQFAISAHGVGPGAQGSLNAHSLTGSFHATVTCLRVIGNDGIATAVVSWSNDPRTPVGEVLVGEGVDNGHPSKGTSPDLWRLSFQANGGIFPTARSGCWQPFFAPVPVRQGNIVVK